MQQQRGFSLIEFVVVIAILGVITTHILGILSTQLQSYEGHKATVETQTDSRLVSDLVARDVRMAGYMVPQGAGISGVDGGTDDPDTLCVSDPTALNDDIVELATERFPGAALTTNLTSGGFALAVDAAALDIDGDGDVDFAQNAGVIITGGGTHNHCARVVSVNSGFGWVVFSPAAPGTFVANVGSALAVPAILYERTSAGLTRNGLVISRQVEDFQVEFGVDADSDQQLVGSEFPVDGLFGSDPSQVSLVRISVLTRAVRVDQRLPGLGRQALANRDAGSQDDFRRRLVRSLAAPRNLL